MAGYKTRYVPQWHTVDEENSLKVKEVTIEDIPQKVKDQIIANSKPNLTARGMITNYYTGEKWYLVNKDGGEVYVSESDWLKINNQALKEQENAGIRND